MRCGLYFIDEQQTGFNRDRNTQLGRKIRNRTVRIVYPEVIRQFRAAFHVQFNEGSPMSLSKVTNQPQRFVLQKLNGLPSLLLKLASSKRMSTSGTRRLIGFYFRMMRNVPSILISVYTWLALRVRFVF
jgi:hypothetical protein